MLPLTPFEEYMLCDDRPDYPMTGFFRLRFSGRLEAAALQEALRIAVARHPLTRAKVQRDRRQRPCWVADESYVPTLERWSADSGHDYPAAHYLDLSRGAGTRFWLVDRAGAHDLVAQMHHAYADALGMCRFIDDLLVAYARVAGLAADIDFRPLDPDRLPKRNQFGLTYWKLLRMLPKQAVGLLGARQFFMRKSVTLAPPGMAGDLAASHHFPTSRTYDFDPEETSRILAAAKRRKVTVNDLLARDLFLAIGTWRERHGVGKPDDWIRFSVPVNLRGPGDDQLSIANVVSLVFLDRKPHEFAAPQTLLESIQYEMQLIKRLQLGFTLIGSLIVARRLPGGVQRVMPGDKCLSTCVFSNLGVIMTETPLPRRDGKLLLGDVTLEGLDFVTPLRPHTAIAFCPYTYAGRLSVMMHHDPRSLTEAQADDLLENYLEQIRRSLEADDRERAPDRTEPVTQLA